MDRLINFPVVRLTRWGPCKHSPPLRSMALEGISCLFSCRLSLCGLIFHPESRAEEEQGQWYRGEKADKTKVEKEKMIVGLCCWKGQNTGVEHDRMGEMRGLK